MMPEIWAFKKRKNIEFLQFFETLCAVFGSEYLGSKDCKILFQAFALIPLTKDRALYKLALADLWKNFEEKNGSPAGRNLALINFRYDSEATNLFFYTRPRLTLVADVIEFTE